MTAAAHERTPLLLQQQQGATDDDDDTLPVVDQRLALFDFLEAKTGAGRVYEKFMMFLIVLNVLAFILGSLFVEQYNPEPWASRETGICGNLCDALLFGNYVDNGLQFLQIGSTSVLEIVTVFIFTVEYCLRLYTADLLNDKYAGWTGRLRWIPSFFSVVDLASTVPFYLDAIVLRHTDLAASSFLRMFRLLRMMRVEGRYDTALTMVDDVVDAQKGVLLTAGFVGFTVWMAVSSLYYLAERRNFAMIYCAACDSDDDFDPVAACTMDSWGSVDCPSCTGCYHLYESIPMASYYALLNLFGEFPHIDTHSASGKIVGACTAAVAVAVFALPVGIIGNGFEEVIAAKRLTDPVAEIQEEGGVTQGFCAVNTTFRGRMYNLLHAQTAEGAFALEVFINMLIVATAFSFMLDTVSELPAAMHVFFDSFELVSVSVFTIEYGFRVYSATEDPKYNGTAGRVKYMCTFLALIDLLSFLPYWIEAVVTGGKVISSTTSTGSDIVKSLRLLRIFRFERYTHAFLSFDDVFARNMDILAVTAFTAVLFWVFFSACLYFSERDSIDEEMASNYNTIPNAMWVTLLNLSGESPLSQYSVWGKIATAVLGLFATGYVFEIAWGRGRDSCLSRRRIHTAAPSASNHFPVLQPLWYSDWSIRSWLCRYCIARKR
jgi:Ion transport protein